MSMCGVVLSGSHEILEILFIGPYSLISKFVSWNKGNGNRWLNAMIFQVSPNPAVASRFKASNFPSGLFCTRDDFDHAMLLSPRLPMAQNSQPQVL